MRRVFILLTFIFAGQLSAQSLYFPPIGTPWVTSPWDTLSASSLGWCDDKIDSLLDYLEDRSTKAFILLKDGKIVIEKYYGTFTVDSNWYWASAGKSLTAFMVGIAQQQGYLSIDDTTSEYLGTGWTSCTPTQEEKITIRHQLSMTTGLDDSVPDYTCTDDTCLQYLADAGTRWAYHNGPYTLLDTIIEITTGLTSFNTYVWNELTLATGIAGAYYNSGYNRVFASKPRSMARFGLLILNGGNWNGNQIMTDTAYFNDMVKTSQLHNESYGYLWWLNGKDSFMLPVSDSVYTGPLNPSAPEDMFAAVGKNGQLINVVPSMNLVYIRMGETPGFGGAVPLPFNDTIWQYLNEIMCNVSMEENVTNEKITVYPNPVVGTHFNIQSENNIEQVQVLDLRGKLIKEYQCAKSKSLTLEKPIAEPGIYLVEIKTEKGTVFRKVIFNE